MSLYRFGVMGGTGWMGSAMLSSLLRKKTLAVTDIAIANRCGNSLPAYPQIPIESNDVLVSQSSCVVLSVRPQDLLNLNLDLSGKLVLSIMAGVSIKQIQEHTGANRVVRAMPNAAAEIGESYTPYVVSAAVSEVDLKEMLLFLSGFGLCEKLQNEDDFNYFVALTGSSHGTMAFFAQSLINAGINHGVEPLVAERAIRQVMKGMGQLIADESRSPEETVERVTVYGGTTCALVESLKSGGVGRGIENALIDSYKKASSNMSK